MKKARNLISLRVAITVAIGTLFFPQSTLVADGWHNLSLETKNIDEWLQSFLKDVRTDIPALPQVLGETELKSGKSLEELKEKQKKPSEKSTQAQKKSPVAPGGRIQADLTPQQQALLGRKADTCLEILAFMDPHNILPHEFPKFQMSQIPRYRSAAKQLLRVMGPPGASAVVAQLRTHLMGGGALYASDVRLNPDYYKDLLEVLGDAGINGNLTERDIKDLRDAAAGKKQQQMAGLANQVNQLLDELENADIATLFEWAAKSQDKDRKERLRKKAREKLKKASITELLEILQKKPASSTRNEVENEMKRRLKEGNLVDLLKIMDAETDPALQKAARDELERRDYSKYSEVVGQIPDLVQLLNSKNPEVAKGAQGQLEAAFRGAVIPECLRWLGQEAGELKKIIWDQLDDRMKRADPERKAKYRDEALAALKDKDNSLASRLAAIELLTRLKDREAVGELINALPTLPRETWPKVGELLRKLTGQNFGPMHGDGVAELTVSLKKWRAWWDENKGK